MEMEEKLEKLAKALQKAYTEEVVNEIERQLESKSFAAVEFFPNGMINKNASVDDVLRGIGVVVIVADNGIVVIHSTADGLFVETYD